MGLGFSIQIFGLGFGAWGSGLRVQTSKKMPIAAVDCMLGLVARLLIQLLESPKNWVNTVILGGIRPLPGVILIITLLVSVLAKSFGP